MLTLEEHLSKIKHGNMVDNQLIEYLDIKNPMGQHWQRYSKLNIGVKDIRPRRGTFTTPWNSPNDNNVWGMPELRYTSDTLPDLLDERAIELFKIASETNREIYIMWSGGIDSSGVLVSFIKNLSEADRKILTVVLNTDSLLENMDFYQRHISGKLKIIHINNIDVTNEFLDRVMLLHGDPGDCIYGPSIGAFSHLIADGKHMLPANENRDLIKVFYDKQTNPWSHPEFGEWYVNKVADNFAEANLENAHTIADYWWWHYFNLKFQFSMQRPLQHALHDHKKGLTKDRYDRYMKEVFFHTERFQLWSYSNLQTFYAKIDQGVKGTKWQAREYLYNFDKNQRYYDHKVKIASTATDRDRRTVELSPFYYDNNNVGYFPWETNVSEAVTYYLENFKG
jgi:hypothetical protein